MSSKGGGRSSFYHSTSECFISLVNRQWNRNTEIQCRQRNLSHISIVQFHVHSSSSFSSIIGPLSYTTESWINGIIGAPKQRYVGLTNPNHEPPISFLNHLIEVVSHLTENGDREKLLSMGTLKKKLQHEKWREENLYVQPCPLFGSARDYTNTIIFSKGVPTAETEGKKRSESEPEMHERNTMNPKVSRNTMNPKVSNGLEKTQRSEDIVNPANGVPLKN